MMPRSASEPPAELVPRDTAARVREVLGQLLTSTAQSCREAARSVAEILERELGTEFAVLARSDEGWEVSAGSWQALTEVDLSGSAPSVPSGVVCVTEPSAGVAVVGLRSWLGPQLSTTIQQACAWIALHRSRDIVEEAAAQAAHEANELRAVTEQLRSVRDLDQVLHSIASRTIDLLDADICGVLLREGEVLEMRSCVGHRFAETAKLRMRQGQGVAGRVFATGQIGRVDDYLADDTISSDFRSLAGREAARSALAVPLKLQGDLIGVLEVWRRRSSVFSDRDVLRLVTLSDFASIAIDNARLYEEQQQMLDELRTTRVALEREVEISRRTASLQRTLIDAVLDRPTLAALADVVACELGCVVAIYGPEGQQVAVRPKQSEIEVPDRVRRPPTSGISISLPEVPGDVRARLHPVFVESERLGAVLLIGAGEAHDLLEVACSQVAMACSLAHLHERAASRARAEALEQAMWDLLTGPIEARLAARSRAHQMGVSLTGPHQVVYGKINDVESLTGDAVDHMAGEIVRAMTHDPATARHTLMSLQGDHVVAVTPVRDSVEVRDLIGAWTAAGRAAVPGLSISWGVSRIHEDAFALASAFEEATTALTAALRLGVRNVALYDELGIVRLLLGSGSDPDLHTFIDEVTGPLLAYDEEHDGSLILTLRTYFDANCSQKTAAERLFIHHKTMRYRLERIRQLTGLDLTQHEDRLRADVALRILQVSAASADGTRLP